MNFLLLYNARETYTNTVFEHLDAFSRFSSHRYFYAHHDGTQPLAAELARFDGVGIHYCARLPYDQVSEDAAQRLAAYPGLKFLFIQDEYEHTHRAWHWIRRLGIRLVFTVVPAANVARVYPPGEFPGVTFVSVLTGYVPEELRALPAPPPPSQRSTIVGYRGRPLGVQYGALGREKVRIGRLVKAYCEAHGIAHDIAWTEDARIYGPAWYDFIASCRAMLGTESGSNVFDWDGTLPARIAQYRGEHPDAGDEEIYAQLVAPLDLHGVIDQVSPRVFESIALRTVLVQFEGAYSGVIEPWKHFIPLKKDGSNLDEVAAALADGAFVDAMTQRAYDDVVASGRYGHAAFVATTDRAIERAVACLPDAPAAPAAELAAAAPLPLTTRPVRAQPPQPQPQPQPQLQPAEPVAAAPAAMPVRNLVVAAWRALPAPLRPILRPVGRHCVLPAWRSVRRAWRTLGG